MLRTLFMRTLRRTQRCCWYVTTPLLLMLTTMYTLGSLHVSYHIIEAEDSDPGPLDEVSYVKPKQLKYLAVQKGQNLQQATPTNSHIIYEHGTTNSHLTYVQRNTPKARHNSDHSVTSTPNKFTLGSSILKLYVVPIGGLGNQLFQAAACFGIALWAGREPVLSPAFEQLYRMFNLPITSREPHWSLPIVREEKYATFSSLAYSLPRSSDAVLSGFFQSWRYFSAFRDIIVKWFRLKDPLLRHALQERLNACNTICSRVDELKAHANASVPFVARAMASCDCSSVVSIGVHIRRKAIEPNYKHIPSTYLRNAMDHFRRKYRNVHFMVVSDDVTWCAKHVTGSDVYVVPEMTREHHFAVLLVCHHHVLSVGTFGWWAAWLAGGSTVYFDNPVPESFYNNHEFNNNDYFPTDWIPLH